MAYLDSQEVRTRSNLSDWILRIFVIALVLAFGWFALTIGADNNGSTQIVQEPITRSF